MSQDGDTGGTAWDSGHVRRRGRTSIAYAGRALESRTRYSWKVRVWDEKGRASGWSEDATFETAFVDADEFGGEWIGSPNRRPAATLDGAGWIWSNGGGATGSASAGDQFFRTEVEIAAGAEHRLRAAGRSPLTTTSRSSSTGQRH